MTTSLSFSRAFYEANNHVGALGLVLSKCYTYFLEFVGAKEFHWFDKRWGSWEGGGMRKRWKWTLFTSIVVCINPFCFFYIYVDISLSWSQQCYQLAVGKPLAASNIIYILNRGRPINYQLRRIVMGSYQLQRIWMTGWEVPTLVGVGIGRYWPSNLVVFVLISVVQYSIFLKYTDF